jgi:hypothetical protein
VAGVPLLSGSRVVSVPVGESDVVLRPPPPPARVVDVEAAVRDALAFPLAGPALDSLVRPEMRVTVLIEPPALPVPGGHVDPRPVALATALDEIRTRGVRDDHVTLLVAGGLARRIGRKDLERVLPPPQARAFRGHVAVHDAAAPNLRQLAPGALIHPAVVDADLVVVVSSAESIMSGGPGSLVAACDAPTIRSTAGAQSLVQASGERVWARALEIERAVASRVRLLGLSLVLDHPRLAGRFRGYPHDPAALEHVARSPLRRAYSRLPASVRRGILRDHRRVLTAAAAFAGAPSVAHVEALVRAVDVRGTHLGEPLDTLVVGVPWIGAHVPREPLNPITSAGVALGLALRQWRDAYPVREGGTVVLVHSLTRSFVRGTQDPYRRAFEALRREDPLAEAERAAASDARAIEAYRAGRACHPLLPYADWAGCRPALGRVGRVIVAGSRDAVAARALGFVPSHSISSALEMAHGVAGGRARVGVLLAPPYAPLLVGSGQPSPR